MDCWECGECWKYRQCVECVECSECGEFGESEWILTTYEPRDTKGRVLKNKKVGF